MKNKKLYLLILIIIFFPKTSFAASRVVIDEVQVSSSNSSYDEYIKVTNYSDSDLSLEGIKLKKRTPSALYDLITFPTGAKILAQNSIIIAYSNLSTNKKSIYADDADYTYSNTSLAQNFSIYLQKYTAPFIDLVSFGDITDPNYLEGNSVRNPADDEVFRRINGFDSDSNSADFHLWLQPQILDPNVEKLLISEMLPNPETGSNEWFELYNPTNQRISLSGLKICDGMGSTHCYFFNKTDTIESNSYKAYDQQITKMTLNDTGDFLELQTGDDNIIYSTDSYEGADDGISFSLFGSEWKWTKKQTKGTQNIFEDIIELEIAKQKVVKTKKASTKAKTPTLASETENETEVDGQAPTSGSVKGAETEKVKGTKTSIIGKKEIGWSILALAVIIFIGYFSYENKERFYEIYNKLRRRNS